LGSSTGRNETEDMQICVTLCSMCVRMENRLWRQAVSVLGFGSNIFVLILYL
jgi:hypothetical protein